MCSSRRASRGRRFAAAVLLLLMMLPLVDWRARVFPDRPDETPALWNPCDVLDERFVARALGSETEEHDGEPTQPECRFVPAREGDPAVTVNYQLFTGTLEEVFTRMDIATDAEVDAPQVERADDARIVVNSNRRSLGVTGFVKNGDLVQNVNVVDPAPYDRKAVVAGVEAVLARLSEHAVDSGVTEESGGSE